MEEFIRLILVCVIALICYILMNFDLIFIIPGILGEILMVWIILTAKPKKYYRIVPPIDDPKNKLA